MSTKNFRINENLYLVQRGLPLGDRFKQTTTEAMKGKPVNHIAVIDCSWSMSGDLPQIRKQLKQRIPKLLNERDTLSIVWFASRRQHGVLLDHEPVNTLVDLNEVNKAVDRWLKPCGLTGFKEPLEDALGLAISKKNDNPYALFFMSDGHDNQWRPRTQILEVLKQLAPKLSTATIVEYGYYADRAFLTQMAAKAGGAHIFAEDFDRYAPAFENAVTRKVTGAPRSDVKIEGDPIGGFAFLADGGELFSFEVQSGMISVPADSEHIWYLSPQPIAGTVADDVGEACKAQQAGEAPHPAVDATYAAIALFSLRAQPKIVYPLLKATGDVQFIERFGGCFGKQKYSEFMDAAKEATFGKQRWAQGYDPERVPADDAFTVLDFLRLLASDDGNRVLLDHDAFEYNKISRGSVRVDSTLQFKAKRVRRGYSLTNLVYNEKRPNVSFKIRKEGEVDLLDTRPKHVQKAGVPKRFKTNIWRNYAVIKDGLVNVSKLPVSVTNETWAKLRDAKIVSGRKPAEAIIDLSKLPVLNRNMVKTTTAEKLFGTAYELQKAKAAQKVWNGFLKRHFPERQQQTFAEQYSPEAAAWLTDQGIKPYGFSPKTQTSEARDFYMGKELKVSLKGLMTLPKLEDVEQRIKDKKNGKQLTPVMLLMEPFIKEVASFKRGKAYKEAPDKDRFFKDWLENKKTDATNRARAMMGDISQILMSVIVGQTWFSDFATINETSKDVTVDGQTITGTVSMNEIKVTI